MSQEELAADSRRRQGNEAYHVLTPEGLTRRQAWLDAYKARLDAWARRLELQDVELKSIVKKRRQAYCPSHLEQSVYVCGSIGSPVKIGIAFNVRDRVQSFQTGYPYKLRVFHVEEVEGDLALEIEQLAHTILTAFRLEGEWFDVSPERAAEAVGEAKSQVLKARRKHFKRG